MNLPNGRSSLWTFPPVALIRRAKDSYTIDHGARHLRTDNDTFRDTMGRCSECSGVGKICEIPVYGRYSLAITP